MNFDRISTLKNISCVAITSDGWTDNSGQRYVGMTYHYINNDWEIVSLIGDVAFMPQRHTGIDLAKVIMDRANEKLSESCLISTVVTDSDAKFINACRHILKGHDIQNVVNEDEFFTNNELYGWRCFDHLLNLAIRNVLDNETLRIFEDVKIIQNFVNFFRNSPALSMSFRTFLQEKGKAPLTFSQDIITRWNSTFYMIQSVIRLKHEIFEFKMTGALADFIKGASEKRLVAFDELLFSRLERYHEILEQIEKISRFAEGEYYPTLAHVPQWIYDLKLLLNWTDDESHSLSQFKSALFGSIELRFGWIFTTINLSLKAAALHPFHGHLSFLSSSIQNSVWQALETECDLFYDNIPPSQKAHFHSICKSSLSIVRSEFQNPDNTIKWKEELGFSALEWWKQQFHLNLLFPIVKMFLAIPATSAPAERLFSAAGQIQQRYNMNPDTLESFTIIRDYIRSESFNFEDLMKKVFERGRILAENTE